MKLLSTITGLAVVSAQVPFDFPTRTDEAAAFFTQANGVGVFGDVRFDLIMEHGCHCRKLAHFKESGHGGPIADELDGRCHKFFMNRNCLKDTGGVCHPWSAEGPFGRPIDARMQYKVNLQATGPPNPTTGIPPVQFYSTAAEHCSLENDPCLKAICLTDYQSISGLMIDRLGHADYAFKTDNSACGPSATPRGTPVAKHCEGDAPDQHYVRD